MQMTCHANHLLCKSCLAKKLAQKISESFNDLFKKLVYPMTGFANQLLFKWLVYMKIQLTFYTIVNTSFFVNVNKYFVIV